jgi:DNA-binding CsgD family transcriptional regulator
MKQRRRIYYSAAQRSEIWDRWQAGEPMSSIGRRFDRESSSVFSVISPTGGIRPPDRHRAKQAQSLFEREEISRWLSMRRSLRSIALHLGRSASTISREVQRNGGSDRYRAARSDQAAWDRARRPKLCALAEAGAGQTSSPAKISACTSLWGSLRPCLRHYPRDPHLGVEPQEVVLGQAEPADGCLRFYTPVRAVPVIFVQPDRQLLGAPI